MRTSCCARKHCTFHRQTTHDINWKSIYEAWKGVYLQGVVATIEDLVAAIAAHTPGISLRGLALHPTSRPAGEGRHRFVAWRASSSGCQISGGTISLLPGCILLLTGRGAHFKDTTFSGVTPLQLHLHLLTSISE